MTWCGNTTSSPLTDWFFAWYNIFFAHISLLRDNVNFRHWGPKKEARLRSASSLSSCCCWKQRSSETGCRNLWKKIPLSTGSSQTGSFVRQLFPTSIHCSSLQARKAPGVPQEVSGKVCSWWYFGSKWRQLFIGLQHTSCIFWQRLLEISACKLIVSTSEKPNWHVYWILGVRYCNSPVSWNSTHY